MLGVVLSKFIFSLLLLAFFSLHQTLLDIFSFDHFLPVQILSFLSLLWLLTCPALTSEYSSPASTPPKTQNVGESSQKRLRLCEGAAAHLVGSSQFSFYCVVQHSSAQHSSIRTETVCVQQCTLDCLLLT